MTRAVLVRTDPAAALEDPVDDRRRTWRGGGDQVVAWLQAIVVALPFGIVLLVIGIPFALLVRVIADALAWAAGAL